jgi:hypothetical protein
MTSSRGAFGQVFLLARSLSSEEAHEMTRRLPPIGVGGAYFQRERANLQRRVFPVLRHLCVQAGFRFQPIDLRWGESSRQRGAANAANLLRRARALSAALAHFSLLILLGGRHGTCFLPEEIPASQAVRLRVHLNHQAERGLDTAYLLDENAVPPAYVLRQAAGHRSTDEEALRQALARAAQAAGFPEVEQVPFLGSATNMRAASTTDSADVAGER